MMTPLHFPPSRKLTGDLRLRKAIATTVWVMASVCAALTSPQATASPGNFPFPAPGGGPGPGPGFPPGFGQRPALPGSSALPKGHFPVTGETYVEADQRFSATHALSTSMTTTIAPTQSYGGTPRLGFLNYDNKIPGPTFILRPGQRFNLDFNNQLSEVTNLHFHGLHVSPSGISDNVFLKPAPGTSQKYALDIPRDHPGGMYWYHPHMHELSQAQLDRGLAGAIIIEGGHKLHPVVRQMRQRVILFQWLQYDPVTAQVTPDPLQFTLPYMTLLNGVNQPLMKMRPGESQYWHLGNATGTVWYTLRLDGFDIFVIAEDGNPLAQPRKVEQLEFSPAKRFEVIVTARGAGYYAMKTLGKNIDGVFSWQPETLAMVSVEGNAVPSLPAPEHLVLDPEWHRRDLRNVPVAHTRTVTFTQRIPSDDLPPGSFPGGMPPGGPPPGGFPPGGMGNLSRADFKFFVDGHLYDENVVNTTVEVNSVEEWTIVNDSDDAHAFHIHVNPFLVIAVDGKKLDVPYWADTAIIDGRPGSTVPRSLTFRTRFADFPGRFVYHCHNLFHEDQGMMAVIDVVRSKP